MNPITEDFIEATLQFADEMSWYATRQKNLATAGETTRKSWGALMLDEIEQFEGVVEKYREEMADQWQRGKQAKALKESA